MFSLLIFKSSVHFLAIYPFFLLFIAQISSLNLFFVSYVYGMFCQTKLLVIFFFFLVLPPVTWDLSSPNWDQPSPTAVEAQSSNE